PDNGIAAMAVAERQGGDETGLLVIEQVCRDFGRKQAGRARLQINRSQQRIGAAAHGGDDQIEFFGRIGAAASEGAFLRGDGDRERGACQDQKDEGKRGVAKAQEGRENDGPGVHERASSTVSASVAWGSSNRTPSRISRTRSARWATLSSWLTAITVLPSWASRASSSMMSSALVLSTLAVGSSARII